MATAINNPPGDRSISRPYITSQDRPRLGLVPLFARKLRAWNRIPPPPLSATASQTADTITIICISDTHNTKPLLPDGDILLHAGDLSQYGLFDEIQTQLDWLNSQPHRHKFVIAGNHDLILDSSFVKAHPDRELDKPGKRREDLRWGDVRYLCNGSAEIHCGSSNRTLKIYGSPLTPRCGNFAFQYDPVDDVWAGTVPDDADILLTHGPPALHLDEGKGCKYLLQEIRRVRPKLVVFGHIHSGRGEEWVRIDDDAQTCYENVVLGVSPWVNLLKLIFYIIWQTFTHKERPSGTHFVNAAVVAGRGNCDRKGPIVVYM